MKILIDVNYCPDCENLSCEITASTPAFDYMESSLFLDSIPKINDVVSMIVDHYIYDLQSEYLINSDISFEKGDFYEKNENKEEKRQENF